MTYLFGVLVAALTAVVGSVCGGLLGEFSVRWLRLHSGQGNAAYFVVAMVSYGAITGLVAGIVTALMMAPQNGAGFGKALGTSSGLLIFVTLVSLGLCRLFAHIPPEIDGRRLSLEVEVRLPKGATPPEAGSGATGWVQLHAMLGGSSRHSSFGGLDVEHAREENGRWIVPASLEVESALGDRRLEIGLLANGPKEMFPLPLPPSPRHEHLKWSGWLPASEGQGEDASDKKLTYRFRVQTITPRNFKMEEVARQSKEFNDSKAELDSIPADAPLEALLKFTQYGPPDGIKPLALARMAERTNFVAEMRALMLSKDAEVSGQVLRLMPDVPNPPPDLLRAVEAAGQDIAEQIRKVNATSVKDDPEFYGARDVVTRFQPWLMAAAKLREVDGGNFVPELKTILELSRVRKDSEQMQQNVCRVASLCLKDWAGIKPLKDDPK